MKTTMWATLLAANPALIEGVHYTRSADGQIFPVVRGGDGPAPTLEELRAGIDYLDAVLEQMHADNETRAFSPDDQKRWDDGMAERSRLFAEHEALAKRHAEVLDLARNKPAAVEPGGPVRRQPGGDRSNPFDLSEIRFSPMEDPRTRGRQLRDQALRAIERTDFAEDEHRAQAELLLRKKDTRSGALAAHMLVTGSDEYMEAFAKVATGRADELTGEERQALTVARAMSLTNQNGGYAIPFFLDPTIILTNNGTINDIRRLATTKTMVVNTWHGVTSAGVTASYDAEATEVSDDSPSLDQPSIQAEKAQAFVPFSIEAEEDITNLAGDIAMMFGDAKDRLEALKFAVGAGHGSNEPKGVVTAVAAVTASRVAATTNNTFGAPDVYALLAAVPARHRRNATWLANNMTYQRVRQFDTSNGSSFWVNLNGDTPAHLIGKPIAEAEEMDGTIGTGDDDILLVGDFKKYYVVDRVGMSVEFVPHLFGSNGRPTGQRGWYAYWRNGADVVDANAFRLARI